MNKQETIKQLNRLIAEMQNLRDMWESAVDKIEKPEKSLVRIDWGQVDHCIPKMLWDDDDDVDRYIQYTTITPVEGGYRDYTNHWDNVSLVTGVWIANTRGIRPLPDGVLVNYIMREDEPLVSRSTPANMLRWNLSMGTTDNELESCDIIAFKIVGLVDGYTY